MSSICFSVVHVKDAQDAEQTESEDDKPVTKVIIATVELQWLEHLWDHGNLFEIWVVRATEG